MANDPFPEHLKPMLCGLKDQGLPPDQDDRWAYEIKWDGVRAVAYVRDGEALIESRTLETITKRYPELAGLGEALAGHDAVLDAEVVALDEAGRPSFQLLQRRMGVSNERTIARRMTETPVTLMAFDLLHLDGKNTMPLPYVERRELLAGLGLDGPYWQAPAHHVGEGHALLEVARRQNLEGVVGKQLESPYRPGTRSSEWIKVRNRPRQEFVIGGWTPGEGARRDTFGALLLGYWDGPLLRFAGGVGTGFTDKELKRVLALLEPLRRDDNPFEPGIGGPKRKDSIFCEPKLVCDVEFTEWTDEKTLRQPSYKGMRDDKPSKEVVLETQDDARSDGHE